MEIDSDIMLSLPLAVHRETYTILVDPIAPVDPFVPADPIAPSDIPIDITVGHKMPPWAQQTLQEIEGHKSLQGTTRERKRPKRFSI
jgi:hypothetical protein